LRKLFVIMLLWACFGLLAGTPLERAAELYHKTDYEGALRFLDGLEPVTAAALALIGKANYGRGDFEAAYKALERSVEMEPGNAHYWHWLGKAYGRRAETSSFIRAPGFAKKCRIAFEKAVALDGTDTEAASDLFSYYLNAPGFLGGGVEKAADFSERIRKLDEAAYYHAQSELARKRGDDSEAERRLREAMRLEPQKVGRILDLASFLSQQQRYEESDRLFLQAERAGSYEPQVVYARASALVKAKRNMPEAKRLLQRYLTMALTPDDPPRRDAEELLREAKGD
jgi:tetratricopeptide (TPR) repeat protein